MKRMQYLKKLEAKVEDSYGRLYFFKLTGNKNLAYGIASTMHGEIDTFVSESLYFKELSFMLGSGDCNVLWLAKGIKEQVHTWEKNREYCFDDLDSLRKS